VTPSLPRKYSTTELQRQDFSLYNDKDESRPQLTLFYCLFLSGKRGSDPPPIAWKAIALPNELLPHYYSVGKSGLEPLNSEEDRFTVCCNCRYATFPKIIIYFYDLSRWRDLNPRPADYKSAALAN
jgi:hypothetical protein